MLEEARLRSAASVRIFPERAFETKLLLALLTIVVSDPGSSISVDERYCMEVSVPDRSL